MIALTPNDHLVILKRKFIDFGQQVLNALYPKKSFFCANFYGFRKA